MKKLFIIVIIFADSIFAQQIPSPQIEFNPEKYICYSTNEKININGKLNENSWKKADWTKYFVDIEGELKPLPKYKTKAKMLWDKNNLYFAAEIQEPHIWATLHNRDTVIFYDNDFEIFIDPDGDTHKYSEFEMNAFNTIWDLLLIKPYRDGKNVAQNSWDIKGIKTAVSIHGTLNDPTDIDSCWIVELAFPWTSFKEISNNSIPPKDKDQWRINFSRVEWKTEVKNNRYQKVINPKTGKRFPEDNWVWSPQGVINMHYPEMWGYVQFSTNLVGTKKDKFQINIDEYAKWELRQIYYLEHHFYEKNGRFMSSLKSLGYKEKSIEGFQSPPVVESTNNLFYAYLLSKDGSKKISIKTDGEIDIITKK